MRGFDITDFVRDIPLCDVSEVHVAAFHFFLFTCFFY